MVFERLKRFILRLVYRPRKADIYLVHTYKSGTPKRTVSVVTGSEALESVPERVQKKAEKRLRDELNVRKVPLLDARDKVGEVYYEGNSVVYVDLSDAQKLLEEDPFENYAVYDVERFGDKYKIKVEPFWDEEREKVRVRWISNEAVKGVADLPDVYSGEKSLIFEKAVPTFGDSSVEKVELSSNDFENLRRKASEIRDKHGKIDEWEK